VGDPVLAIDCVGDADASARLAYYGLRVQPFQPTADPEFLWLGTRHREVLTAMKAGVLANAGLVLLTGEVGTGKTTLAHALEESLGEGVSVARLDYPGLDPPDFFKVVGTAYGLGDAIAGRETFLQRLVPFLIRAHADGRTVLLILDEAQSLSHELFEEVGHLSALEHEGARLLNVLLVGQNELGAVVLGPQHRDLRQRVAARYTIEPLTMTEIDEYIRRRLTVAGAARSPFGADAVREISALSGGVPRLINLIADLALLRGFQAEAQTITAGIIADCARDLSPWDLGGRRGRRRRYAVPAAGARRVMLPRRGRRAIASALLLAALVIIGGYFYAHGWPGARRGASGLAAAPSVPATRRSSETIDDRLDAAPARMIEAPPPAPTGSGPEEAAPARATANPPLPASPKGVAPEEAGKPHAAPAAEEAGTPPAAPPTAPPVTPLRPRAAPLAREGAPTERAVSEAPVRNAPAPSPSPAENPPRPRAAPPPDNSAAKERADTPDPGAIIDWLLRESPARRE
jgi:general secretion pathway protein A